MNDTKHPLWQRFLVKAAIDYFIERKVLACILVDNSILKDGVLESMHSSKDYHEFIICVAPGYATQLDLDDFSMEVTVKFSAFTHRLEIPYEAIRAVLAAGSGGVLTDEGHMNIIEVPPPIRAPGAHRRANKPKRDDIVSSEVTTIESPKEIQPEQQDLQLIRRSR